MSDNVNHPSHYADYYPFEVIDAIRLVLERCPTLSPFEAYCLGNELKYRLRAGFKGDLAEDIGKAMKYREFRTTKPDGLRPADEIFEAELRYLEDEHVVHPPSGPRNPPKIPNDRPRG